MIRQAPKRGTVIKTDSLIILTRKGKFDFTMRILYISLLFLFPILSWAQQSRVVTGVVVDTSGAPLRDVYINLISGKDSLTSVSDAKGLFKFDPVKFTEFTVTTNSVGFQNYAKTYLFPTNASTLKINKITLTVKTHELSEVVITSNPVTVKEDTIEYRASAYKVREGAPVEDMLKKLPGVTVDKDGNVTAQGTVVKRVRVNGKDYFGGDVQTATQNLPADIIENVQMIDDYGERANLTGVKEGDPEKILNINIQKGKRKGSFGNGTVGAGTDDRYLVRVSANNFNEDRQISLLGSLNNTNANLFNFNGGGKGGGARGANVGSAERSGSGDGITYSKSLGLNYRDNWGKNITSYGSYSFSGRSNNTVGTSFEQDFNPLNSSTNARSNTSNTNSSNHRLTENIEYKIDSSDYLKVTPYFSYASSNSSGLGVSQTSKISYSTLNNNQSGSNSTTPAFGSDLFYLHRFKKRGRNINITSSIDYSSRDQLRNIQNSYINVDSTLTPPLVTQANQNQAIDNNNNNTTTNIRVSYDEPISKYTALDFSYAWNQSVSKTTRDVDDVDLLTGIKTKNMVQSNNYSYQFVTNRFGVNLHSFTTKYNYLVGIVAQPSNLTGDDIGRNIKTKNTDFNIAPTARFVYNFSRSNNFSVTYGGTSREPSFSQLQPVSDSSNLKNIVTGNPNLHAEFTNRFSIQYNKVGLLTGSSFFSNISFNETQNKIVSSRVNDPRGTGTSTSYLNTNGFNALNGNLSYTKPLANRKFTYTISGAASYDNNISFTDNQKNMGRNWVYTPGARIRLDIPDVVDLDLNGSYNVNTTTTKYTTYTSSTTVNSLTIGLNGKNFFFKDYTLGYDLSKTYNTGYISTVNSNPTLLNLYVEARFLKNHAGTLRFQGYDLFNQNTGISRVVNGTIITDYQNNRLGRYYLLTFNLRLQKFAGKLPFKRNPGERGDRQRNEDDGSGGGRRNGGGGGGGGGRRSF